MNTLQLLTRSIKHTDVILLSTDSSNDDDNKINNNNKKSLQEIQLRLLNILTLSEEKICCFHLLSRCIYVQQKRTATKSKGKKNDKQTNKQTEEKLSLFS